jgi:hypothetical protein
MVIEKWLNSFAVFKRNYLKPYLTRLLDLLRATFMEGDKSACEVIESIGKHVELLKPVLPKHPQQTVICIGEYPAKILLKRPAERMVTSPIFIEKSSEDIVKWSQFPPDISNVLGLDTNNDTHFWFHVLPYVKTDEAFIARLRSKLVNTVNNAIIVASIDDGVGSASLPTLISQLKEWNINSVALAVLPSKVQPPDVQLNALASLSLCASKDSATVLLMDRDHLESYVGVNRKGCPIRGNLFIDYLLELMSDKETLVQELTEMSRSFKVRMYTVLSATGASLKVYGSLENILSTALFKPLLTFDLASASILYVLLRMPLSLKDKLQKGQIELAIADWFKERASLKSIYVSEPIYVEDVTDRLDIVMFVGGFDLTNVLTPMEKKARILKSQIVKKGFIKENEWQAIVKNPEKEKD